MTVPCLIIPLLCLALACGCTREEAPRPPAGNAPAMMTVCQGGIVTPLTVLARERDYFRDESLSPVFVTMGDGKLAMESFINGTCDAAIVGETPIVTQVMAGREISIIASVSSSDNFTKIVARKDMGIQTPADLNGKRVGMARGTITHFFFEQFARKNGLDEKSIRHAYMPLKNVPDELAKGSIDAASVSDSAYLGVRERLGDGIITFQEPGLTYHAANLVVKNSWLAGNSGLVVSFLRALVRAEHEMKTNPAGSLETVSRGMKIPPDDLKLMVANQNPGVTLNRLLILSLEDQARWTIEMQGGSGTKIPNFSKHIARTYLEGINRNAVRLR